MLNLPNTLTLLRIALTVVFTALLSLPSATTTAAAFVCFAAAAYTDLLDGRIARRRGQVTNLGKLLDPIADKILVAAGFIMIMRMQGAGPFPAWAVVAIFAREFAVTGARALAASRGAVLAATLSGKIKAVSQMVYLVGVLGLMSVAGFASPELGAGISFDALVQGAASLGAIVVAIITLYSGYAFFRANWAAIGLRETD